MKTESKDEISLSDCLDVSLLMQKSRQSMKLTDFPLAYGTIEKQSISVS